MINITEKISRVYSASKENIFETVEILKQKFNSPIRKELLGIGLFSMSVFMTLSLFTFSEYDRGDIMNNDYQNWLGPLGAKFSSTMFMSIGFLAYVFPIIGFTLSLRWFWGKNNTVNKTQLLGIFLIILSLFPLSSYVMSSRYYSTFLFGGKFGFLLKEKTIYYVSSFGLWIIYLSIMMTGSVLLAGKPLTKKTLQHLFNFLLQIKKKYVNKKKVYRQHVPVLPVREEIKKEDTKIPEACQDIVEVSAVENESAINIVERSIADAKSIRLAEKKLKKSLFSLPPLSLLDYDTPDQDTIDPSLLTKEAEKLKRAFLQFGIEGKVREIRPGPVVTNYEFVPAPGIKLSRIAALSDDIAMAMSAVQVRIVTPIPGKGAVGIEVPNENREMVFLKEIVADKRYQDSPNKLAMAVGKDVEGNPFFMDLADMPHVLIAGTTGSGKSVSVNAMICSILYRATPDEVKFLMIDPKMLELSIYNGIPHLLLPPIIDSKKAANALKWAVKEMETRYMLMKELSVRDINAYNHKIKTNDPQSFKEVDGRKHEHMPYIVVVVDEYADLLSIAGKEVEGYVMRLAQKARACGIHVMLATQRPSVDVITGVIKANFPVRMGFRLASMHDSKTIVNKTGAEKLLGKGDALIMPPGTSDLVRVHGAFISEKELLRVVSFWQEQRAPDYNEEIACFEEQEESVSSSDGAPNDCDEKFNDAISIVKEHNRCSTSFLQRHLSVGYNRAARIVEQMEKAGVVGPVLNARGDRDIFINE